MSVSDFISLLGGVALFLFGMSIMGDALKKVAGNQLELVLYNLTSTPIKGVLLGTGVTAVIQSSSATSVMVVGFVNSGMMKVNQAIGIVLGAILGTSVTGWVLCLSNLSGGGWVALLSTSTLTALMATIGTLLRMISRKQTTRHVGEILLGFAVLMYGMTAMSGAVEPLRESAVFINAMTSFANPLLGILVGIVFTSVIQSASAAVGILQALAATGAVTFEIALPIIMGIAIGAAVPVLLSALGANVSGKRTAFVYLLIDVLGVVIWGCIFYAVNAVVHFDFMDTTMTTVSIALANTLFRLATVVALMPLIGLLEKLVCMLVPDDSESSRERQKMDRLEERFLQHPALAIEQSRQVTDAMAQCAMENLLAAMLGLEVASGNDQTFSHSDIRRTARMLMQMLPGTDFIFSGYSSTPNYDNMFAGSNFDAEDFDDYNVLQRDLKVDGGLRPVTEQEVHAVRLRAAKAMQAVFRVLGFPEITDEEVEQNVLANGSKDVTALRDVNEDLKAAKRILDGDVSGLDVVKALDSTGFTEVAEALLNMLKQRVSGDYLHTAAILDRNFHVYSSVNSPNTYQGPGTGYRLDGEAWEKVKNIPQVFDCQSL